MKRYKFFINYKKEEKWLEDMAAQGYTLQDKKLAYIFHEEAPKKVTIRIDYRIFKNKRDFDDYCVLFEDSGWTHIAGTKSCGAQYFMSTGDSYSEDIFSDERSRAGRYKRKSDMWRDMSLPLIGLFAALRAQGGAKGMEILSSPKDWYLTPGLWESHGIHFWRAFLFETPFAVMRNCSWIFVLIALVLSMFFYMKSQSMYKEASKNE